MNYQLLRLEFILVIATKSRASGILQSGLVLKRACLNKAMAHMWFMHDTHLGRAFLVSAYSG